jgi:hypothetical protein
MGIIMSETSTASVVPQTLEDKINEVLGEGAEFTPYAVANAVNSLFSAFGVEKEIPTQMAYNYCNNGLIKATVRTVETKKGGTRTAKFVSRENAIEWINKYVSKNLPK